MSATPPSDSPPEPARNTTRVTPPSCRDHFRAASTLCRGPPLGTARSIPPIGRAIGPRPARGRAGRHHSERAACSRQARRAPPVDRAHVSEPGNARFRRVWAGYRRKCRRTAAAWTDAGWRTTPVRAAARATLRTTPPPDVRPQQRLQLCNRLGKPESSVARVGPGRVAYPSQPAGKARSGGHGRYTLVGSGLDPDRRACAAPRRTPGERAGPRHEAPQTIGKGRNE